MRTYATLEMEAKRLHRCTRSLRKDIRRGLFTNYGPGRQILLDPEEVDQVLAGQHRPIAKTPKRRMGRIESPSTTVSE